MENSSQHSEEEESTIERTESLERRLYLKEKECEELATGAEILR